ncbi:MAG: thiamine-phosphate kinase [Candidatus Fibromonas sp.]|jgi:thiamine-monophosphate kinase|nr:thiamine-phosphate kinase [Candidatus Fibromonas sp.]
MRNCSGGSEIEWINNLLGKTGRLAKGVGDDAFVFKNYLISADMSVEGTHFRLDWSTPEQAVEKCLLSNFSDINAMGGKAKAILFLICINRKWSKKTRDEIAGAVAKVCKKHKVKLLGGDTVGGNTGVFSVTVFGKAKGKILLRSVAKNGDDIWLAGYPGCSGAGLRILEKKLKKFNELVNLHKLPSPPLMLGEQLAKIKGIGACIDLSDSLAESLSHISVQSKVQIKIKEKFIPVFPGVSKDFLLNGGEDYCLLFTAKKSSRKNILQLAKKFSKEFPICKIGEAKKGSGIFLDGKELEVKGWRHF